jgi:hypothetical protein
MDAERIFWCLFTAFGLAIAGLIVLLFEHLLGRF